MEMAFNGDACLKADFLTWQKLPCTLYIFVFYSWRNENYMKEQQSSSFFMLAPYLFAHLSGQKAPQTSQFPN